jgi:uncharacterized protein YqeY
MTMSLKAQITDDMKSAMKAGQKERLRVIRLILAAIKQVEVDQRIEMDDSAVLTVLDKMVKQRRDSVKQYQEGNRNDLADIEIAEIAILDDYLPEQLSEAELDAMIDAAISSAGASSIRDMGKVMADIKTRAAGRADIGVASAKVKARLS